MTCSRHASNRSGRPYPNVRQLLVREEQTAEDSLASVRVASAYLAFSTTRGCPDYRAA